MQNVLSFLILELASTFICPRLNVQNYLMGISIWLEIMNFIEELEGKNWTWNKQPICKRGIALLELLET
jgi:hypothetical protein